MTGNPARHKASAASRSKPPVASSTTAPTWLSSAKIRASNRAIPFSSWSRVRVLPWLSIASSRLSLATSMPTNFSSEAFIISLPCQYEVVAPLGTGHPATVRVCDKRLTLHAKCSPTGSASHVAVGLCKVFRKLPVTSNCKHTSGVFMGSQGSPSVEQALARPSGWVGEKQRGNGEAEQRKIIEPGPFNSSLILNSKKN